MAHISVRDTGAGITHNMLEAIFNPFVRESPASSGGRLVFGEGILAASTLVIPRPTNPTRGCQTGS
jgi:nitrogen-specific signal transduction histidine kinase